MRSILKYGAVIRGWIGISVQNLSPELAKSFGFTGEGVLVSGVVNYGPAFKAGIRPGDIITKVDNKQITQATNLLRLVASLKPGETHTFHYNRYGHQDKVNVYISQKNF